MSSGRLPLLPGYALSALLLSACLSSKPQSGTRQPPAAQAPSTRAPAATSAAAAPAASATIVSQAQPGFSGKVISGTIEYNGGAPPPGSTLYLALVKSANDPQPRSCIDADRNPVNDQGQFYAQVACNPQAGDQLMFVLIIGPAAQRDWHMGVVPLPSDLTNVQLVAPA
jgi:hypothetical protein